MRTTLKKIIKRAGLVPWPRLFHNLRASRQSDLAKSLPLHVVCEWIGNSKLIAAEHYLKATDEDYAKAIVPEAEKMVPKMDLKEVAQGGIWGNLENDGMQNIPENCTF